MELDVSYATRYGRLRDGEVRGGLGGGKRRLSQNYKLCKVLKYLVKHCNVSIPCTFVANKEAKTVIQKYS